MAIGRKRDTDLKRDTLKPLSDIPPGSLVRVKRLTAPPEVAQHLREIGFCEGQSIRLLHQNGTTICQVSNGRMGLCGRAAKSIWVEPLSRLGFTD